MKKINLKLLGAITFSLLSFSTFSQNWKVGGNAFNQMGPPGNQPILGTLAGNNKPLLFHTNGIGRMVINNGATGINDGKIAMGNNLPAGFTPSARLHLHQDAGLNLIC
ncbi:MAG: hypothetical protein COA97_13275 [Flavobacteriales bacterium]|nr:MAG: hypothetical protein COA97_13275 [Flavobacteriales bacterium]